MRRPTSIASLLVLAACAVFSLPFACTKPPPATWVGPDGVSRVIAERGAEERPCDKGDPQCKCERDSDCKEKPGGACIHGSGANSKIGQRCAYDACSTDAQCKQGEMCVPAGPSGERVSRCLPARCRGRGDCIPDGECKLLPVNPFTAPDVVACVYPSDQCDSDRKCKLGQACLFDTTGGHMTCQARPSAPP